MIQKCGARADNKENIKEALKLNTMDFLRPIESAKKPHKCADKVSPKNGELIKSPFLAVVISSSQVAADIEREIPRTSTT